MTHTYQPIIGLEIHVELSTSSKMFCQCNGAWQSYPPNVNTCPVCLGLPGALPVPNKQAVERTIKIAQALGCTINVRSHFDRKHYFYPDLPKGYQISQYDEPIGVNGILQYRVQSTEHKDVKYATQSARIHRVHLEEDTGKLSHVGRATLVDFNRSGVPLVEIVTEADFRSSDQVKAFLQELHTIIKYLDVSDADMEKGSMRLEPNISVKSIPGTEYKMQDANDRIHVKDLPKFKVEVKNINSFNFVKKAVDYEVKRQSELLDKGETPLQETRGWDEKKSVTVSQRTKEDAHDYRYFPEPDIPPMRFDDALLDAIRNTIPELPGAKVTRYVEHLGVKVADAMQIARDRKTAEYFDRVCVEYRTHTSTHDEKLPQTIANVILNKKISIALPVDDFVKRVIEIGKPKNTDTIKLNAVVQQVLLANEKSVTDYRAGKTNALMFLVGQIMKEMKGEADAGAVREALLSHLGS